MNSQIAAAVSAGVRRRPLLSTEERRGEQQNPPVPPQAAVLAIDPVPLIVRRQRVLNGSRRQRDLAAVRMAEELELLEALVTDSEQATAVWEAARESLRTSVPESTFRLWIKPLQPIGANDLSLILEAPNGIREWAERRYSSLIREALQDVSDYREVRFVGAGGAG